MVPLTLASLSGMMVQIRVSAETEQTQQLEVDLSAAAEDLRTMTYLPCAGPEEYQKAYELWKEPLVPKVAAENSPAPVRITRVDHWNAQKSAYLTECSGDDGAQRLTIEVHGEQSTATGTVVKRNDDTRKVGSG